MAIAEQIRYLVKHHPKSRQQIAADLFISSDCLGNYINGRRCPDAAMIRNMAKYFHVSTDFILCISDQAKETASLPAAAQEQQLLILFRSMTPSQQEAFLHCGYGIAYFSTLQNSVFNHDFNQHVQTTT